MLLEKNFLNCVYKSIKLSLYYVHIIINDLNSKDDELCLNKHLQHAHFYFHRYLWLSSMIFHKIFKPIDVFIDFENSNYLKLSTSLNE